MRKQGSSVAYSNNTNTNDEMQEDLGGEIMYGNGGGLRNAGDKRRIIESASLSMDTAN